MECVLDVRTGVRHAEEPALIGLVLGEQEGWDLWLGRRGTTNARPGGDVRCGRRFALHPERRPLGAIAPGPGIAIPGVGQDVQLGRLRAAIVRGDPAEDVVLVRFRVVHDHIEITAGGQRLANRVDQLELTVPRGCDLGLVDQPTVRVFDLRVLVQHPHERMAGHTIEIVIILLDVFAVVPLLVRQAEEALLEERVAAVPQGQGEAEVLESVAEAGQPVLVPPIGAAPGVVVGEVIPGRAVGAVVFADGPPRPFGQVGTPAFPVGTSGLAVAQAAMFGGRGLGHGRISVPGTWDDGRRLVVGAMILGFRATRSTHWSVRRPAGGAGASVPSARRPRHRAVPSGAGPRHRRTCRRPGRALRGRTCNSRDRRLPGYRPAIRSRRC